MLRNSVRVLLCALLIFCFAMGTALAESCKYCTDESPCDVIWWVDTQERTHSRACRNHVEDKEDSFSYVVIAGPYPCTPDSTGACTVCGWDYVKDENDEDYRNAYMLEFLYMMLAEGTKPVDLVPAGKQMSVSFTDAYFENLHAAGVSAPEAMYVDTVYTLETGAASFPYTGEPITPASLSCSAYGPAGFLIQQEILTISGIQYENNTQPGTATASVTFSIRDSITETLSVSFTIAGEAQEPDIEWPLDESTALILPDTAAEIRSEAFRACDAVSVVIPAACVSVGASAFADSPALAVAVFYGGDTQIDASAFDGCQNLTIVAPAGSQAQAYARANGLAFMVLPE